MLTNTSSYEHCILMNCVLIVLTLDHTVYCYLVALFWLLFLFSSQLKKISLDILPLTQFPSLSLCWVEYTYFFSSIESSINLENDTPIIICWMLNIWEKYYFQLLQSIFPLTGLPDLSKFGCAIIRMFFWWVKPWSGAFANDGPQQE